MLRRCLQRRCSSMTPSGSSWPKCKRHARSSALSVSTRSHLNSQCAESTNIVPAYRLFVCATRGCPPAWPTRGDFRTSCQCKRRDLRSEQSQQDASDKYKAVAIGAACTRCLSCKHCPARLGADCFGFCTTCESQGVA